MHAPLDQHPEVASSRLVAEGLGLTGLEEYFPIAEGIPGGAAIIGDTGLGLGELAERLRAYLGPEIPVDVLSRPRESAGRVAVAAGGGADRPILEASLERGCETYVTGNAATQCRLDFVQESVRDVARWRTKPAQPSWTRPITVLEKPPQLAMVGWFEALGLPAEFRPGRPERASS